jgi:hypothetical protein
VSNIFDANHFRGGVENIHIKTYECSDAIRGVKVFFLHGFEIYDLRFLICDLIVDKAFFEANERAFDD